MAIKFLARKLKEPFVTEQEEFINHLKIWFPVAIVIGLVVGLMMSLFFIFIFLIHGLFEFIPQLLLMLIATIIIVILLKIGFEIPEKNGINYVISTKHHQEIVPLNETKEFVSSGIAIGSGLPIGKEGPALVIGSALACKIAKIFRIKEEDQHNAITIGSAAATGALFQAPMGSAIFASEVPYKQDSDEPMLMSSFLAAVIAAVTLRTTIFFINEHLFPIDLHIFEIGDANLEITFFNSFLAFLLGIIIGYVGQFFISFYYWYKYSVIYRFELIQRIIISVSIALILIFIGTLIFPELYFTHGLDSFSAIPLLISEASKSIILLLLVTIFIQIISTSVIIGSGFPGGIFGPSLAVGAMIGIIYSILLGITQIEVITAFTIIGMSASHAATTKTPIASVLLIMEITSLPSLIIPIVMANIAAYMASGHKSLYENQIHSREAKILQQLSEYDQLDEFYVKDIMTGRHFLEYTTPETSLQDFKNYISKTNKRTFPVLENEHLKGIITIRDLTTALENGLTTVEEAMTREVVTAEINLSGRDVMYIFINKDLERVPVVDDQNKVLGIITIKDVLRGHQKIRELNKKYFSHE
ncbi:MAG: chloride channel protein [Candidatus Heimdallarchaeota archaeon]|nr:chloride channel protein [Candidatus Heimdallarchaeota archaeon]